MRSGSDLFFVFVLFVIALSHFEDSLEINFKGIYRLCVIPEGEILKLFMPRFKFKI